jgi:hypothetical protein
MPFPQDVAAEIGLASAIEGSVGAVGAGGGGGAGGTAGDEPPPPLPPHAAASIEPNRMVVSGTLRIQ